MNTFLEKLKSKKKIELVDKSEEMYEAYLIKSNNCLKSAKILSSEKIFENSIINSQYSMYNCVIALFYKCGIKCENHTGSIILLKEIFRLPELSESLQKSKKSRIDSQYYSNEEFTLSDSENSIKISEDFILKLRSFINNIKNSDIDEIRNFI